mgnify:FL=1
MEKKKRFSLVRKVKGQIATEQMMLTGIILVMLIPIIFYITQTQTQTPYMTDTLVVLDNSVESLSNLGSGSSTTVVVQVPASVVSASFANCNTNGDYCTAIRVDYADGSQDVFEMSYFVQGSLNFLEDPGLHYVTLYHKEEDQNIIFQECGDGVQSGGEQCEACVIDDDCVAGTCEILNGETVGVCKYFSNTPCRSDGTTNYCYDHSEKYGCFCQCDIDADCLTNLCTFDQGSGDGYCEFCESDGDCPEDYYCSIGVCTDCDQDGDGEDSDFYCGGLDCNDNDVSINTGATEICTGGIDENCDGLVDCLDGACGFDPVCSVSKENECTTGDCCSDGQDNDNDGPIDCNDGDCDLDSACTGECSEGQVLCNRDCNEGDSCLNTCGPAECSGGVTNEVCEIGEGCLCPDCNGQQDSCASGLTCEISSSGCDVCTDCTGSENSNAFCSDGLDNDCDGFVDCYDADCFGFTGTTGVCCVSGGDGVCEGALNQCNAAGTGTNYFLDSCDVNCNLQTGNTCASSSLGSICTGDLDCDGGTPQNYCPTTGTWCDSGCGEIDRDSSQVACEDSGGNCDAETWSSSYVCCNGDDGTDNCDADTDCSGGYLCTNSCQCSTGCSDDNECQYGYFCVNGDCSTGGSGADCEDNSDCSTSYTCDTNYDVCVSCDGNSVQNDPSSGYGHGLCERGYNSDGTGGCDLTSANSDEKAPNACVGNLAYISSSCYYYNDGDSNLNTCDCIVGAGNYFSSGNGQDKCCGDDAGESFGTDSSAGWCCINGNKYSNDSFDSTGQYFCLNGALSGCNGNLGGEATSFSSCGRTGGWYCDGYGNGLNTWKDQISLLKTPDDCDGSSQTDPYGEGNPTSYDGGSCEGNRLLNDYTSGVAAQNTGWQCNGWQGPYVAFVDLTQTGSLLTARIEVADEADSYGSGGYVLRLGDYDTVTNAGHYTDSNYPGTLYWNPSAASYSGVDSNEGIYGDYFEVPVVWSSLSPKITQEKSYFLEVGLEENSGSGCSTKTCDTEDPNSNEGTFTTSSTLCVPVTYDADTDNDCCPLGSNVGDNTHPGIDDDGGSCVSCDSNNKQVLGGTGDGLCESKCGASSSCDEKAANSAWVSGQTCNWCGTTCASGTDSTVGNDACATCSKGYQSVTSTDLCYSNIACGSSGWAANTYDCDNSDVQGEGTATAKESEVSSSSCTSSCSGSNCCQINTATCNAGNSCGKISNQFTLDEVTDKTCYKDESNWKWKTVNNVVENSALECTDGYDNDCDGVVDCDDSGCDGSDVCAPQCSDGIDNDGDGFIDFGKDIGCMDNNDDNEVNPSSSCTSSNTILKLRDTTNAHTEKYNQNNYQNVWCYPYAADNNRPSSCNGKEVIRAAFESNTNAHVEYGTKTTSGYTDVCFSTAGLECTYTTGICPAYHANIGSISASTNAHAGAVGQYSIKVCCTHFP